MSSSFLIIVFLIKMFANISAKSSFGVIEGFYWNKANSIDGVYAEYSHKDRRSLLSLLNKLDISVYVYGPKELLGSNYERAYNVSLLGDLNEWKQTFLHAKQQNVEFLWALYPGWIPTNIEDFNQIFPKIYKVVSVLKTLGCSGFVLSYDDTPGGTLTEQYGWHGELINQLEQRLGNGIFKAYIPGHYYGSSSDLAQKLSILHDTIKKEIPFVWCGPEVWDNEILKSDIPALPSPRGFILWDNWIAVDSADINKLTIDPPKFREKALVDNINQFWLNLNFPSSFMVPAIASLSRVQVDGESNYKFYWENDRKVYENEEKINNVLNFDAKIWCEYFVESCSEEQISAYYQLLRGINWMRFDSGKIQSDLLAEELTHLADEIKKRQ